MPSDRKLSVIDATYCVSVAFTAVAMLCGGLVRSSNDVQSRALRGMAPLFAYLLCGHFPAGIVLLVIHRQVLRPPSVAICVAVTGVWFGMCLAAMVFGR